MKHAKTPKHPKTPNPSAPGKTLESSRRVTTEPQENEQPAAETQATDSLATATLSPETLGSNRPWQELQRGDCLGRYLVLELIGRGSMGQVYSAYDPKLNRKVALKLLAASRGHREALRCRLIREARALARLSHPNVVAVFDAETVDGQVFIATEFVVGQTLSEWLRNGRRSRAEILGILADAGQGLAAAHEAGLVHRDFKGSNIMVADNHRVVVLDFGLARQLGPSTDQQPSVSRFLLGYAGATLALAAAPSSGKAPPARPTP